MDWILDVGPVGMFLITSIGGFVLYLLTKAVVKAPGTVLQTKFMALGTLTGKTYDEIVEVCGAPNSTSTSISADGLAIRIYVLSLPVPLFRLCAGSFSSIYSALCRRK